MGQFSRGALAVLPLLLLMGAMARAEDDRTDGAGEQRHERERASPDGAAWSRGRSLWTSGAIVLGVGYVPALIGGVASAASGCSESSFCSKGWIPALTIPVVGPFLAGGRLLSDYSGPGSEGLGVLVLIAGVSALLDGITQVAGVALIAAGVHSDTHSRVPSVMVHPIVGPSLAGISVGGLF